MHMFLLSRLYESAGRAIAVTPASALVFGFISLSLELVDGSYWSEVLCCTIMTHPGDIEVKVTDLELLC